MSVSAARDALAELHTAPSAATRHAIHQPSQASSPSSVESSAEESAPRDASAQASGGSPACQRELGLGFRRNISSRRVVNPMRVRSKGGRVSSFLLVVVAASLLVDRNLARPCTPPPNATLAPNATAPPNASLPIQAPPPLPHINATNASNTSLATTTPPLVPVTTPPPGLTDPASLCGSTPSLGCLPSNNPSSAASSITPPEVPEVTPPPIVANAANAKNQITSDLGMLNDTIVSTIRQDFFAGLSLPPEANYLLAALLLVCGVASSLLGHRYMKVFLTFSAMCAGSVASMFPIDKVLGGTLCGEFRCVEGGPAELFCQWSLVAGLGVGLVCASFAMRLVDAGSAVMGAGLGLLAALLAQPVVDQSLATANGPPWTHFLHYILFFGAGGLLGKLHPIAFQIAISAVIGALMAGAGLSFFVDRSLSPAAMMSGEPIECSGACIGQVLGAVALACGGMVFQTRMHKKRMMRESGEAAEAMLGETLGATKRLLDTIEQREERDAAGLPFEGSGKVEGEGGGKDGDKSGGLYPELEEGRGGYAV